MSIMSISWTLFKLLHFWNLIDLDSILQKGDELLKSFNEFRYLGVEDLPHGFLIDFRENRTGKITVGAIWYISLKLSVAVNRLEVELSSFLITVI